MDAKEPTTHEEPWNPTNASIGANAGWYSNDDSTVSISSAEEILSTTFSHAKLLLRSILKTSDYEALFPPNDHDNVPKPRSSATGLSVPRNTISDVLSSLKSIQNAYECRTGSSADPFERVAPTTTKSDQNRSRAKARVWLTGLSDRIMYYGNIFDVLVQHHPEYVSLAWGTFKLLFVAISNHAETASKLSKSISLIAELLPQHSLLLILYPTPQMQSSVARLFAHILNFFVSSLKWYKDSRYVHAIKSVFQPWDLKFRPEFEAIAAEAKQIRRLADVALKAEVRDMKLEVVQTAKHWTHVLQEMSELKAENQRLMSLIKVKFETVESSIQGMYQEMRSDFSSQRTTLSRIHLNQMLSLPIWNDLPTSGAALKFCRSISARHRLDTRLTLPDVRRLETWTQQKDNAILFIDTYKPLTAKIFMVNLIDLVLDSHLPVIWALRYAEYQNHRIDVTDIIRMLILQTMQTGADGLLNSSFPVTVERLQEAASLSDWVAILDRLLRSIGHTYIMLDADLLSHMMMYERREVLQMLEMLRSKLSGSVKIVTATSCVGQAYVEELEQSNVCTKIRTGDSLTWRQHQVKRKCQGSSKRNPSKRPRY